MVHLKEWDIQFHNHKVQGERKQATLINLSLKQFLLFNLCFIYLLWLLSAGWGKISEQRSSKVGY